MPTPSNPPEASTLPTLIAKRGKIPAASSLPERVNPLPHPPTPQMCPSESCGPCKKSVRGRGRGGRGGVSSAQLPPAALQEQGRIQHTRALCTERDATPAPGGQQHTSGGKVLLAKHLAPGSGNFAKGESKTPAHPAPAPARTQRNLPCHIFFTYFVCKGEKKEKIKEKKQKEKKQENNKPKRSPIRTKRISSPPPKLRPLFPAPRLHF